MDATFDHPLDEVLPATNTSRQLVLPEQGYSVEKTIYMKVKNAGDEDAENTFTLAALYGFRGVWSQHLADLANIVKETDLLDEDVESKTFTFAVTLTLPAQPTLVVKEYTNSIKTSWSLTGLTGANKPDSYVVGLVKNAGLDFNINTVAHTKVDITNGDEHYEFTGLQRFDANQNINTYVVYVYSKNSVGISVVSKSALLELPANELPANYIEKFSVSVLEMADLQDNTRKCKGMITINKNLWGGEFDFLTVGNDTEYGVAVDDVAVTVVLKQVLKSNDYTFDFELEGKKTYYLTISATTKLRAADPAKGITSLTLKTSSKLYATVNVLLPPLISNVTYAFDHVLKNTLYEMEIDNGGDKNVSSVLVQAIPNGSKSNNMVGFTANKPQTAFPAEKMLTLANGNLLYKVLIPYIIQTTENDNGVDLIVASNSIGQASAGLLTGREDIVSIPA